MFGRYSLDDIERPALALATLAAAAVAFAALVGAHGDPAGWQSIAFLSLAAIGPGLTLLSTRPPQTAPVATAALLVTAVSGRFIHHAVSEGLLLGVTLTWSLLAVLFSRRWTLGLAAGAIVVAFAGPIGWHGVSGIAEGLGHALIAAIVVGLVVVARSQMVYATETVRAVFENAPVGIMEQNWSETLAELEKIRSRGVTDLEAYLRRYPAEVGRLFATARLVSQNAEAARVFPSPGPDGHHSPDVVVGPLFEDTVTLMVDLFEGRYDRTVVWPMPDDAGRLRWHQIAGFRHPAGNGEFIMVSSEITSIKEAEAGLEALVASKDRFVAAISHELRTPLAAVIGFTSELLGDSGGLDDEERLEFLTLANQQAMEAANIIADLLVAARADIGGVSIVHGEVDVGREITETLLGNGWHVPVIGVDGLPPVCADGGRTRQILRNLLTNAVRYGGPNERIVCSADPTSVLVEVRDDGPELSQGELDALFEPYARAHEAAGITESVGLGLTVARHLAGLMGGSLVAFRDGCETVFRLTLPSIGACPVTATAIRAR